MSTRGADYGHAGKPAGKARWSACHDDGRYFYRRRLRIYSSRGQASTVCDGKMDSACFKDTNRRQPSNIAGKHRIMSECRADPPRPTKCDSYAGEGKRDVMVVVVVQYNYPFKIDGRGRSATAEDEAQHIRQLIEQVLFTSMGERVNRPDFGSGINQLVFAPNSQEIAAATQLLVQGALQTWLGHLILVELVEIKSIESTLQVIVKYRLKKNPQQQQAVTFSKEV